MGISRRGCRGGTGWGRSAPPADKGWLAGRGLVREPCRPAARKAGCVLEPGEVAVFIRFRVVVVCLSAGRLLGRGVFALGGFSGLLRVRSGFGPENGSWIASRRRFRDRRKEMFRGVSWLWSRFSGAPAPGFRRSLRKVAREAGMYVFGACVRRGGAGGLFKYVVSFRLVGCRGTRVMDSDFLR